MTREYFNKRYNDHCEELQKYALRNNLDEARRVWAHICELLGIASELDVITAQEYNQLHYKAQDCFYNNL